MKPKPLSGWSQVRTTDEVGNFVVDEINYGGYGWGVLGGQREAESV